LNKGILFDARRPCPTTLVVNGRIGVTPASGICKAAMVARADP
jgi:hypothetical protein